MARPRKPTNVLALNGSFANHPERARERANEPEPKGELGPPPKHLSAKEKAAWAEVVQCSHPGTVFENDRLVVEHTARALAALRADKTYGNTALMTKLMEGLGRLGLTPSDRSKVKVLNRAPNANPFDKFKKAAN